MKVKFGVMICILVLAVSFFSSLTGYVFGVRASKEKAKQTQIPAKTVVHEEKEVEIKNTDDEKKESSDTYVVKENGGSVAIFIKNSYNMELYKAYDIAVNLLPQSDREMLKEGVEYESLSEALLLIEDYS